MTSLSPGTVCVGDLMGLGLRCQRDAQHLVSSEEAFSFSHQSAISCRETASPCQPTFSCSGLQTARRCVRSGVTYLLWLSSVTHRSRVTFVTATLSTGSLEDIYTVGCSSTSSASIIRSYVLPQLLKTCCCTCISSHQHPARPLRQNSGHTCLRFRQQ